MSTNEYDVIAYPDAHIEDAGDLAGAFVAGTLPPGYRLTPLVVQQNVFPFFSRFNVRSNDRDLQEHELPQYLIRDVTFSAHRDHPQIHFTATQISTQIEGNGTLTQPVPGAYDHYSIAEVSQDDGFTNTVWVEGADFTYANKTIVWISTPPDPNNGSLELLFVHDYIDFVTLRYKSDKTQDERFVILNVLGTHTFNEFISPNERYDFYFEVSTKPTIGFPSGQKFILSQNAYSVTFAALSVEDETNYLLNFTVLQSNALRLAQVGVPPAPNKIRDDIDFQVRVSEELDGKVTIFWEPPSHILTLLVGYHLEYNIATNDPSLSIIDNGVDRLSRTYTVNVSELETFTWDFALVPIIRDYDDVSSPFETYFVPSGLFRVIRKQRPNTLAPDAIEEEYLDLISSELEDTVIEESNKLLAHITMGVDSLPISPGPHTTLREILKADRANRRYVDTLRNQFFLKHFYKIKGTDFFLQALLKSFGFSTPAPLIQTILKGPTNSTEQLVVPTSQTQVFHIDYVRFNGIDYYDYTFDQDTHEITWIGPSQPPENSEYEVSVLSAECGDGCENTLILTLQNSITPDILEFVDNLLAGLAATVSRVVIKPEDIPAYFGWDCSRWDYPIWDGVAGSEVCEVVIVYFFNRYDIQEEWPIEWEQEHTFTSTHLREFLNEYLDLFQPWDSLYWDNDIWENMGHVSEYQRVMSGLSVLGTIGPMHVGSPL